MGGLKKNPWAQVLHTVADWHSRQFAMGHSKKKKNNNNNNSNNNEKWMWVITSFYKE